jgi:hypothetical protein
MRVGIIYYIICNDNIIIGQDYENPHIVLINFSGPNKQFKKDQLDGASGVIGFVK